MSMFTAFNINASGLTAQRYRMDIISENVANANTTRTADGTPYRRQSADFPFKPFYLFVRRCLETCSYCFSPTLLSDVKSLHAGINGTVAQFFLNTEKLVVLGNTFTSGRCACFNLAGI